MENRTQIQSVLKDDRWVSGILSGKKSKIRLHLTTLPGVIGGTFRAVAVGVTPDYFGEASITIICTVFDSEDSGDTSANADFQEIELLTVDDLKFDILFRIPFEAKATEERATWNLIIQLANGITEIFEIPVCRTHESDPEMTAVHIASMNVQENERSRSTKNTVSRDISEEPYTMDIANGELTLLFPPSAPGRPTFIKALIFIIGLWVAMIVFFYWLSGSDVFYTGAGIVLVMLAFLVFLLFGVSHCTINRERMISTHKLFGCTIKSRKTSRDNLAGFSPKYLTSAPSNKSFPLWYWILGFTENDDKRFLCLTILSQDEARVLAKRLNDFLKEK